MLALESACGWQTEGRAVFMLLSGLDRLQSWMIDDDTTDGVLVLLLAGANAASAEGWAELHPEIGGGQASASGVEGLTIWQANVWVRGQGCLEIMMEDRRDGCGWRLSILGEQVSTR